jgi:hypothetical protein
MDEPTIETLTLRKPITTHGKGDGAETTEHLALRLPPGRLVLTKGMPFTTVIEPTGDGRSRIEFKILPTLARDYLVAMTGYDEGVLGQMHPLDIRDAYEAITRILNPIEG